MSSAQVNRNFACREVTPTAGECWPFRTHLAPMILSTAILAPSESFAPGRDLSFRKMPPRVAPALRASPSSASARLGVGAEGYRPRSNTGSRGYPVRAEQGPYGPSSCTSRACGGSLSGNQTVRTAHRTDTDGSGGGLPGRRPATAVADGHARIRVGGPTAQKVASSMHPCVDQETDGDAESS